MMHRLILQTITDFGEATLLIPAAGLVGVYLWLRGMRKVALVWATAFALCMLATVVLKVGFNACGDRLEWLGIRSPSGHVSLSVTFYGCLALLVGQSLNFRWRTVVYVLALVAVVAIMASRLLLHAHTPAEVLVGILIGAGCLGYFWRRSTGSAPIVGDWVAIGSAIVVVGVVTHGHHAPTESLIVRMAEYLKSSTQICVASGPETSRVPGRAVSVLLGPYVGAGAVGSSITTGMSIR
jgi:membrane-associated phospholipid phosphatase